MKKKIIGIFVMTLLMAASTVVVADWDPEDGHKMHFPQLPDPNGWDVYATAGLDQFPPIALADDWQCPESGWIKDIHFWGSWWGDIEGEIDHFVIGIAANLPADGQIPWSRPGETLEEWTIYNWKERGPYYGDQGWYWPDHMEWVPGDHDRYWQYNVFLDEEDWFWQEAGTIYWLFISAIVEPDYEEQPLWGWKSTTENLHFMDDAVWAYWGELFWEPLTYPTGMTMDLAFVVNGGEHLCNPSIDIKKYVWDPDNEDWVDASTPSEAMDLTIGTIAEFKVVIENDGEPPLDPVDLEDTMEDGLEFVSAIPQPSSTDPLKWEDLGKLEPGETHEITIKARVVGVHCSTYYQKVKVIAICACGEPDCDCPPQIKEYYAYVHAVGGPNHPPLKPSKPTGNTNGKAGVEYEYKSSTTDPDGDQISYLFDWGDGTDSGWTSPIPSGNTASAKHIWSSQGNYQIKVKARDVPHLAESPYSDPLSVSMPKSKPYFNTPFLQFLQNHPLIYQLLQRFLNL